jgi:hypothetical protein
MCPDRVALASTLDRGWHRTAAMLASVSASSHSISLKSPRPRSPVRNKGFDNRSGEWWFMIPADPLAHTTPRFTG